MHLQIDKQSSARMEEQRKKVTSFLASLPTYPKNVIDTIRTQFNSAIGVRLCWLQLIKFKVRSLTRLYICGSLLCSYVADVL